MRLGVLLLAGPLMVFLSLFLNICTVWGDDKSFEVRLAEALSKTDEILGSIFQRWQIDKYPNFLESAAMTKTSWDVMKLKFEQRILQAATSSFKGEKFVISFMGSSVTAGHDSPFNVSFPILTGVKMAPAFAPFAIKVISRNAAMGNNPCMPYDVCVRTFAGEDADIVHWEQSYNCMSGHPDILEQFIRQSVQMVSKPVVVFSDSATPNWKAEDCKSPNQVYTLNSEERTLIETYTSGRYEDLVCDLNKNQVNRWDALHGGKDILTNYKIAGIQMFQHSSHEKYKCMGPYTKDWQCCSASWHPSLLGHELRAAHHSFFWLLIYKEAIKSIQSNLKSKVGLEEMLTKVSKHVSKEASFIPEQVLYNSKVSNEIQCFTNFEPRADPVAANLSSLVISMNGWKENVFENFIHPSILKKSKERGYLDVKYLLYGNKDAGPISFEIMAKKSGTLFLCQTPGEWGKLPGPGELASKGFKNFWEAETKVFLTANTNRHGFVFEEVKSKALTYTHASKDTQDICVYFNDEIMMGTHILTVKPMDDANIIISVLLIP